VTGTVFLDPDGAAGVAMQLRRAGRVLTSGGACIAIALPGADAGVSTAIAELFRIETEATAVLVRETDRFAQQLEHVVAVAQQVDHYAPR
jgi:hypothetical protein